MPVKGGTHTDESKRQISRSLTGKYHSEETRDRMSRSLMGNSCRLGRTKKVYQYDTEYNLLAEYQSADSAASVVTHITPANIRACANGSQNTSGGYIWSYKPIPAAGIRQLDKT